MIVERIMEFTNSSFKKFKQLKLYLCVAKKSLHRKIVSLINRKKIHATIPL
jgi:hypothetical protein